MFRAPFAQPFSNPFPSEGVAVPWWLSGGIAAANCVAAYQPKGAADLATSYVNLANPGTYNAAPGTAPTWDATSGWKFLQASSQYLTTGITPGTSGWSVFIRYSDYAIGFSAGMSMFAGKVLSPPYFGLQQANATLFYSCYGNYLLISASIGTGGVLGIAGQQTYLNGAGVGGEIGSLGGSQAPICIGRAYDYSIYATFYAQAFAVFNTALTSTQVAALTTAMNLL